MAQMVTSDKNMRLVVYTYIVEQEGILHMTLCVGIEGCVPKDEFHLSFLR